jgi:uncharacterized membrane protein (DUF106 family)
MVNMATADKYTTDEKELRRMRRRARHFQQTRSSSEQSDVTHS